jgi:hypothetical protein
MTADATHPLLVPHRPRRRDSAEVILRSGNRVGVRNRSRHYCNIF